MSMKGTLLDEAPVLGISISCKQTAHRSGDGSTSDDWSGTYAYGDEPFNCAEWRPRGRGSERNQFGEVGERAGQVLRRERWKADVFSRRFGHGRPVVGECDGGGRRSARHEVVSPEPTAEAQRAVVRVVSRLPRDRARRVEDLHPIG